MKKIMLICFALLLSVSMAACGSKAKNETEKGITDMNTKVRDTADDIEGDVNRADDTIENPNRDDNLSQNSDTKMEVAEKAADKITELDEVDRATVIATDNNAYVAVMLSDTHDEVTQEVEDKIADKVKETNEAIDNVYVSMNPEFGDRMSDYATKINEGHPISGFFEEFTEAVSNVFPDAR